MLAKIRFFSLREKKKEKILQKKRNSTYQVLFQWFELRNYSMFVYTAWMSSSSSSLSRNFSISTICSSVKLTV